MVGEAVPRMISPQWGGMQRQSCLVAWSFLPETGNRKPETGNRKPETDRLAAGFDHRILAP